ncbi:hypothetical protein NF27_AP00030 [Candidatus Jidaibacter acanthamoeba]|uniref:Transposase n=1 Tax=Candidatus Jidaibacter acanthamoebae TaxID=86105 RepID=A0A0C1R1W2_9RICK|nr:hypothetical protein NF27_BE00040 [Candidatus Jidaibacter acanthamoeba]KIE06255.1 hypothetical protein NF27_AP00030 [Candidatus Jidaibacter acanthamoeba]
MTKLIKDLTEISLKGEMEAHLNEDSLEEGNNRRNGISRKQVRTGGVSFLLEVPRETAIVVLNHK